MTTAVNLRELLDIVNVHQIGIRYQQTYRQSQPPPFISYRPAEPGPAPLHAAWQVHRGNHRTTTSPTPYWRDHGLQTWPVFDRTQKDALLQEAQTWAGRRYGVSEWLRAPAGLYGEAWYPAPVINWLRKAVKEAKQARKAAPVDE